MKDNIKDILLIPISIGFNYIFAYLGFIVLTICNQIIIGLNFQDTDFDKLIGNLTFISLEGLMFIGFLYFLFIDLRTLLSRNVKQRHEFDLLEKYSSKGKLLLNQAYNIFKKVPFENSLKHSIKIYPLRILLIIIVILPLYAFQLFIFLFSIVPSLTAISTLAILLGGALLYQFDTKIGKKWNIILLNTQTKLGPIK